MFEKSATELILKQKWLKCKRTIQIATFNVRTLNTGNGWTLATASAWKNSVNATIGGVGILIGPRALKSLNSVEKIQPRMMVATFNGNSSATIISCYSPTNISEETDLIAFYNELPPIVRTIPKHNILVIGGDMNAQIGKDVNHKFSLHSSSSRNGEHLTDRNRLTCLNTKFQKRKGKLWTNIELWGIFLFRGCVLR